MFDVVAPERRELVEGATILFDQSIQLWPQGSCHLLLDPEKPLVCVGVLDETPTHHLAKRLGRVHLEPLRYPGGGGMGTHHDSSAIGLFDSGDDAQQSGLAAPVGTDESGALPGIDYERDVFEDDLGAVAL